MDNTPAADTTDVPPQATAPDAKSGPDRRHHPKRVLIPGKLRNPTMGDTTLTAPLTVRNTEFTRPLNTPPIPTINRAAIYNALAHQAQLSFSSRTTVNKMIAEIVKAGMDALMDELEGKK